MTVAPIHLPPPTYEQPLELTLLKRLLERALYHVNRYHGLTALEAMHAELDKIVRGPEGIPADSLEEALRF
jgi:hypothetical protein